MVGSRGRDRRAAVNQEVTAGDALLDLRGVTGDELTPCGLVELVVARPGDGGVAGRHGVRVPGDRQVLEGIEGRPLVGAHQGLATDALHGGVRPGLGAPGVDQALGGGGGADEENGVKDQRETQKKKNVFDQILDNFF